MSQCFFAAVSVSSLIMTVSQQCVDDRRTAIQNLTTEWKASGSERFDKVAAELCSLDLKTRSLDAKMVVADRQHQLAHDEVAAASNELRELGDQVSARSPLRLRFHQNKAAESSQTRI